jgi:AraC-like DNA-binding protein
MNDTTRPRYLVTSEQDIRWGLTIDTAGRQNIGPGEAYPPRNHPTRYLFSARRGRILDEYQLIYLVRGKGKFTSANCRETEVREGQIMMLFPGEWHSYHPARATGWDEYWIGFRGEDIDKRVEHGFFSRSRPIFNVGLHQGIVALYESAIEVANDQPPGFQQMLAGVVNHLLGWAWSYDKRSTLGQTWAAGQIDKARVRIAEDIAAGRARSPEQIARELNMSYSWFRRVFKQYTGFSPSQYLQELKIQKSRELLTNTDLSSRQIAYSMGFENPDYFCTVFKRRTGLSPGRYRDLTQGRNNHSPGPGASYSM